MSRKKSRQKIADRQKLQDPRPTHRFRTMTGFPDRPHRGEMERAYRNRRPPPCPSRSSGDVPPRAANCRSGSGDMQTDHEALSQAVCAVRAGSPLDAAIKNSRMMPKHHAAVSIFWGSALSGPVPSIDLTVQADSRRDPQGSRPSAAHSGDGPPCRAQTQRSPPPSR